jgi:hypothetical protein
MWYMERECLINIYVDDIGIRTYFLAAAKFSQRSSSSATKGPDSCLL